jgi:hypothetical protein
MLQTAGHETSHTLNRVEAPGPAVRSDRSNWWPLWLLAPALTPALHVIAANPVGIPHVERILAVSFASWLLAWLVALLLQRKGLPSVRATFLLLVCLVMFYWGGRLLIAFGGVVGWSVVVASVVVAAALTRRLDSDLVLRAAVVSISVALLVGPLVDFVREIADWGEDRVTDATTLSASLVSKPDIWLVVLDGHPSLETIEVDIGPEPAIALNTRFRDAGFSTDRTAFASYWITDYSLPSVLNMGLPSETPVSNSATKKTLYRMIGGDNRLVGLLDENGYETYMIESGWSGSTCSDRFNHCIPSSWADEPMAFMLADSLIADFLISRYGYAFTAGTRATIDWVLDDAVAVTRDDAPSFVFAHLLAPHPPFFLDSECGVEVSDPRAGVHFNHADVDPTQREQYLIEQMDCLGLFVTQMVQKVGQDAIVVVLSDHGTDRRSQLAIANTDWDREAIRERMSVFLALSGPVCPVSEIVTLPNVMRQVLSCHTAEGIDLVPDRIFVGPETVLSPTDVSSMTRLALPD